MVKDDDTNPEERLKKNRKTYRLWRESMTPKQIEAKRLRERAAAARYRERHRERHRENCRRTSRIFQDKLRSLGLLRGRQRRAYKKVKRRREQELRDRVYASIPLAIPHECRDDVAAAMLLDLATHFTKLRKADIERRAPDYVRAYWRENPRFGVTSLDAPAYEDGPALIDTIAGDISDGVEFSDEGAEEDSSGERRGGK